MDSKRKKQTKKF